MFPKIYLQNNPIHKTLIVKTIMADRKRYENNLF
jgi:hypothetical protein